MADDFTSVDLDGIDTAAGFFRGLQALRDQSGLTIREVARLSETRVSTVGDYFSGRHLPLDRQQFARILEACGEASPARIEQWQAALSRARRPPGRRGDPPYRGLARYEARDARWFFGRQDITERLVTLAELRSDLPLLLVGPSGTGKSSLLRAGLVPRLSALAASTDGDHVQVYDLTEIGAAELGSRVASVAARAGRPPVLIVDQFEAVFTLCGDEGERRALIDALCDLARSALVILALRADFYGQAMRYGRLMRALQERQVVLGPMTADQVREAVVEPARLARADVADGFVDVVLADLAPNPGIAVASDAVDATGGPGGAGAGGGAGGSDAAGGGDAGGGQAYEPGALPLLSHALLAAWEHSQGATLTVAGYLAGGGIKNALTQSAERAYESLTPGQQRLARRLFLRLVHLADDLPPSRASVSLDELRTSLQSAGDDGTEPTAGDADRVLAVFIEERMITTSTGAAQLTHDALLTGWPRLRTWIEEGAEELRARRRITQGARVWAETGREEAALWRGSQLELAREWAASPDKRAALDPGAREFVDASVEDGAARERHERQRTRRLRSTIAVLTALVFAVAGLTGYAFSLRQDAASAEASAISAARTAIIRSHQANSREIAFVADNIRTQDPAVAAQLSLGGYRFARTPEATASLLQSSGAPSVARIGDSAGIVQWVSVSPDHKLLAAAGADGTLRLWNIAVPGHPGLVTTLARADKQHPVYSVAFSPDGTLIAAAGAEGAVHLWTVSGGSEAPRVTPAGSPLTGAANTIYSVAFSPDGREIAAGSADGTVRLWDVSDPAHPAPAGRPIPVADPAKATTYVQSVAFSPDGRTLAAGTSTGTVWLWNVARPAAPVEFRAMPLTGPADFVSGVAFSPDGQHLAAASHDRHIWLWQVREGSAGTGSGSGGGQPAGAGTATPDGTLTGAANWANTVAFSPDGHYIAAGTSGASVLVWNLATRSISATLPQPQPVTCVTWDGGTRIAASDADGDIALWALPEPVLRTGNTPDAVAYSPDGQLLAVGGSSVQLWDPATRSLLATHPLKPHVIVNGLAFGLATAGGHGGPVLATALSDGTVALFDGKTLAPIGSPFPVDDGQGAAESVAFSPDAAKLVTGADDGTVRFFDVTNPARPRQLSTGHASGSPVYTVAFAPDGATVAAASLDDEVRLWHVATGSGGQASITRTGPALGHLASYAIGLAFSPDSHVLAVGSADKTVHLWNVADPAHPALFGPALTGPSGYVWGAAFSPDGKTLAAAVTDGTVWLWNVASPAHPKLFATLTGLPDHVYSVAFSPSGAQLAATSFEGTVHLWDTSPAAARAAACANLGQPLTRAEWASYLPGVPYRAPC